MQHLYRTDALGHTEYLCYCVCLYFPQGSGRSGSAVAECGEHSHIPWDSRDGPAARLSSSSAAGSGLRGRSGKIPAGSQGGLRSAKPEHLLCRGSSEVMRAAHVSRTAGMRARGG